MVTLQSLDAGFGGVVVKGGGGSGGRGSSAAGADDAKWVRAFAVDPSPPLGNTGGKLTLTVKLDWLTGTFPADYLEPARAILAGYLGAPERLDHGFRTYQECWRFASGALLLWSNGRREACIDLNGDSLDAVPLKWQRTLMRDLAGLGLRASRVDIALDDFGGSLRLDDVEAAAAAGNFAGFRVVKTERPQRLEGGRMVDDGRGVSFGRRGKDGGGRFVQVYDKALESDGEIPSVRLELRTAKDVADEAWRLLLDAKSDGELVALMCRLVVGSIDFIERGEQVHLSRMPRLSWWQSFVDTLGRAKLVVHRCIPPLQKSWEHIKKAVLPTLALIRTVCDSQGYDLLSVLDEQLDIALEKVHWKRQGQRALGLNLVECFG